MELSRLLLILKRQKKTAAICFLLVMGAAAAFTIFGPRAYSSQAKLLVRLGRENATLDATTTLGGTPVVAIPQNRENDINSLIEIIKSRILLDKVVSAFRPRSRAPDQTLRNDSGGP